MKNISIILFALICVTIQAQSIRSVKNLSDVNANDGDIVFLLGQNGGFFSFSNASTKDLSKNNKSWKRLNNNINELNAAWFIDNDNIDSDNTNSVQQAIDELPINGGKVVIPKRVNFYLNKLIFSKNVELEYYTTSDKSKDAGVLRATDEKVIFFAKSNEKGVVNEQIFAASFHPGYIINVKKEISGHNKFLGKDQSSDNPARASFIIQDEGLNQVMQQYTSYLDYNNKYSGWRLGLFRNSFTFRNINENDFEKKIYIGDIIISENGKGHIVDKGENYITVQWFSGRFKEGDIIKTDGGNKCSKPLTKVEFASIPFNAISLSNKTGYVGIGIPNDNAIHPLTVGGKIAIQGTRQHGQYIPESNTNPALVFSNSFENKDIKGAQIKLANNNRLLITDIDDKKSIANIGAVRAHTAFNKKQLISVTSFNFVSVTKIKKGSYLLKFDTPFQRTDYQVSLSTTKPLEYAYVLSKNVSEIIINIVKTGTETAIDPEGDISVICVGGDF